MSRFHVAGMSDLQVRQRVLDTCAVKAFLARSWKAQFNKAAALAEIGGRNDARRNAQLPLLDASQELTRLRSAYLNAESADQFNKLAAAINRELYGTIRYRDFSSMSALALFLARQRSILRDILQSEASRHRR